MIKISIGHADVDNVIMEKIWRFRHQQFVERCGWEVLRKGDGREIDQFDHGAAIHFTLFKNETVIGYSRLLPTIYPHLLSHVYPQIMQGQKLPRSYDIFEWTRCAVRNSDETIDGVPVSRVLMVGVMEFCRIAGISSLIVETHPKLISSLLSNGWQAYLLSGITVYENQLIVPLEVRPSLLPIDIFYNLSSIEEDKHDHVAQRREGFVHKYVVHREVGCLTPTY
ncbi:acyl-homoserine-lactone synthase [Rhizobium hainanense]|uniref:Acyl-homoserine-lactone synthase n=1 Tax=Rhizobium hainanense TaxID=52131 RepID=A0A1C3WIM4_9HYPH|nr:acyl-homoserine-lactone synthase [Rhizobium hainanense]SCB39922.1 acyl-homoserine lactone synthase [Rhizobium hainanense]